jgi:hypothetical protein
VSVEGVLENKFPKKKSKTIKPTTRSNCRGWLQNFCRVLAEKLPELTDDFEMTAIVDEW